MKCEWDLDKLHIASETNIEDVNVEEIKDLADIHVDDTIPVQERFVNFITSTNLSNPYILRSGKIIVKLEFENKDRLSDLLVNVVSRHNDD